MSDARCLRVYPAAELAAREAEFVKATPSYRDPSGLAGLRQRDYARLDELGDVYLDYTGGGLYAESQVRRHHELLARGVFGNPHSHNPTSLASTALVNQAREAVLRYFNASPDEYEVIFSSNASGALKLVGESYPFEPGGTYLLSYDNHNSVNGVREFARSKGARVIYVPVRRPELRLDAGLIDKHLSGPNTGHPRLFAYPAQSNFSGVQHPLEWVDRAQANGWDVILDAGLIDKHLSEPDTGHPRLFAYPAQSNFSGVQHPLEWVDRAQANGWDVILDAAAFVPTNRLDLSVVKPDFVPISFYKMFGYPTGVGSLLARRETLDRLRRPWFAGGTITLASVQGDGWYRLAPGATGFEDGTVDYLGLPAITIGLEHITAVGIETIHDRVCALAGWLLGEMGGLVHTNGAPMARVFGPSDTKKRGATIAFYLLDPEGIVYDVYEVERLAGEQRISVRTGCFCNPGDGEVAHDVTREEMAECFAADVPTTLADCQRLIHDATGKVPNTIRISLGIASTFADVYRFMGFAASLRDVPAGHVPAR